MRSAATSTKMPQREHGRHRQVKWFSLLMGVGVMVASGVVVADVILSYSLGSTFGAAGSSPFTWNQGPDYSDANTLHIVTSGACSAGAPGAPLSSSTCYALATTVNGVADVPTLAVNVYEFDLVAFGDAWTLQDSGFTYTAATQGGTPVGCAFAFISDAAVSVPGASNPVTPAAYYQPTLSYTGGGEGAGGTCTAAVTTVGAPALNAACTGASTRGVAVIDLLAGSESASSVHFSCDISAGTVAASEALSVSYFVYAVTGATTTGGGAIMLDSVVS
jgi:hypothetical protein